MDARVALMRISAAREKIIAHAAALAPHFGLTAQAETIRNATSKDPLLAQLAQWEAVAAFLEALILIAITAPPQVSTETQEVKPVMSVDMTRKGSARNKEK